MSEVGFYRYKTTADAAKTLDWTVNYVVVAQKDVVPVDSCPGDLIIKYLDHNGQYRFQPFNKFYETKDAPEKIGDVNKFLVDIATDQSNTHNVGYRNKRQISATAEVSKDELEKFNDIYASPRVYLYVGAGITDIASDWVEVDIRASNAVVRRRRANSSPISIIITLPEHYTIRMI